MNVPISTASQLTRQSQFAPKRVSSPVVHTAQPITESGMLNSMGTTSPIVGSSPYLAHTTDTGTDNLIDDINDTLQSSPPPLLDISFSSITSYASSNEGVSSRSSVNDNESDDDSHINSEEFSIAASSSKKQSDPSLKAGKNSTRVQTKRKVKSRTAGSTNGRTAQDALYRNVLKKAVRNVEGGLAKAEVMIRLKRAILNQSF